MKACSCPPFFCVVAYDYWCEFARYRSVRWWYEPVSSLEMNGMCRVSHAVGVGSNPEEGWDTPGSMAAPPVVPAGRVS